MGGGLAGIAAALSLAPVVGRVVLCERRPFLGGRAFSFEDPDSGAVVDNGQHVLVGACRRLRALLARIGAPASAFVRQPRLALPILDGDGRRADLAGAPLPPPLHVAAAILRYRHLDGAERRATARDVRALVTTRGAARRALDDVPLGEWLARRDAPPAAVQRFWEPIVRPALNVPVAIANTPLAAFLFERALWSGRRSGALWLPAVGLSTAIGEPARRALETAGVELRLQARVEALDTDAGRVRGVTLAGGESFPADAVVAAVPPRELAALVGPTTDDAGWRDLGDSPIVNVYLWYDRPVAPLPFAGTFDSPLQWIFDRARLLGEDAAGGHCLGVSLSAADEWIDLPKEAIAERCDAAVERLFPARRGARRLRHAVVKEPRATFLAGPGLIDRRQGPRGPLAGLYLAGDWTDTGWPATMEGAVRSGETAAATLATDAAW